jgi:hypothetical protein
MLSRTDMFLKTNFPFDVRHSQEPGQKSSLYTAEDNVAVNAHQQPVCRIKTTFALVFSF